MKAIWNGKVIAESGKTLLVEGNHYFAADTVDSHFLTESQKTTFCSWKGTASYYDLEVNGKTNKDAAWYYPDPYDDAVKIKGYIAFWQGVEIQS
jgi:uncharacterized protein (DUF427 family)